MWEVFHFRATWNYCAKLSNSWSCRAVPWHSRVSKPYTSGSPPTLSAFGGQGYGKSAICECPCHDSCFSRVWRKCRRDAAPTSISPIIHALRRTSCALYAPNELSPLTRLPAPLLGADARSRIPTNLVFLWPFVLVFLKRHCGKSKCLFQPRLRRQFNRHVRGAVAPKCMYRIFPNLRNRVSGGTSSCTVTTIGALQTPGGAMRPLL